MRGFSKVILILFLILISGAISLFLWINYSHSAQKNTLNLIPPNAIYIFQTDNIIKGWDKISTSSIWQSLLANEEVYKLHQNFSSLDSVIRSNPAFEHYLGERKLAISAHRGKNNMIEYAYIVDLEKSSNLTFVKEAFPMFKGYSIKPNYYESIEINKLTNNSNQKELYFAFVDNLMIISLSEKIVRDAILNRKNPFWQKNPYLKEIVNKTVKNSSIRFYINYNECEWLSNKYFGNKDNFLTSFSQNLLFSGFSFELNENKMIFEGYTKHGYKPSIFNALYDVKPDKQNAFRLVSNQTTNYLSFSFEDFNDFHEKYVKYSLASSESALRNFKSTILLLEKSSNISIKFGLLKWIGNEIAITHLRNFYSGKNTVLFIHAKNMETAKKSLAFVSKQTMQKNSENSSVEIYRNHLINRMQTDDLFKLYFKNMLDGFQTPVYTFIREYVVFAENEAVIKSVIDDYLDKRVLVQNPDFNDFRDYFFRSGNITFFAQMPKYFDKMLELADTSAKKTFRKNREILSSFEFIGVQLEESNGMFKTRMVIRHNQEAAKVDQKGYIETDIFSDLLIDAVESLQFKINTTNAEKDSGNIKLYYPDNKIRAEGLIKERKPEGTWKTYYQSGNLSSLVSYKSGLADGYSIFYYDNPQATKRAEVRFASDTINGVYREYFQGGVPKAIVYYNQGKRDGEAAFFKENGDKYMIGKYSNGQKTGEWEYFKTN
jgi:antitoxin component YwqK of YwqJK toxin-antitoxin module